MMVCENCNNEFEARVPKGKQKEQRFCKQRCAASHVGKSNRKKLPHPCEGCDKLTTNDKFCTIKCWNSSARHRIVSDNTRKSRIGKKNSASHNAALSRAHKGKIMSAEARKKISDSLMKSKTFPRGPMHYKWNPNREEQALKKFRAKACHGFIGHALGINSLSIAHDTVIQELGYSPRQLQEHIEAKFLPGMTWENHAIKGWHIDHIKPVISFPIDTPLCEINALSNLQPLWYLDNIRKYWDDRNNFNYKRY